MSTIDQSEFSDLNSEESEEGKTKSFDELNREASSI